MNYGGPGSRPDEHHDTDPSPAPEGNGKGLRDSQRYPCAVHEAALVELRGVLGELRDLARGISRRIDDEIDNRTKRDADIEQAILELTASIGTSPDPIAGTVGTGLKGAVCVALNHTLRESARAKHPSMVDEEESEVTGILDRRTLVVERRMAQAKARKIEIGAWAGGAVVVIGAVAAAVVQVLRML